MKVAEVRKKLALIRGVVPDHETAHILEDEMYAAVLWAIAHEQPEQPDEYPEALARIALESKEIKFPRHCA